MLKQVIGGNHSRHIRPPAGQSILSEHGFEAPGLPAAE